MARVTVWRDAARKVRTLELSGDIERCSHPPTVFFDANGEKLDAIPMKPVVPGSAEAAKYQAIRDKYTHGLSGTEIHFCPAQD